MTVYPQHFVASAVTVAIVAFRNHTEVSRFLRAFAIAFGVAAIAMIFLPALSPDPVAPSSPVWMALRNGTFQRRDFEHRVGLISFPSMHAALTILIVFALWPLRRWRAPLVALAAVMMPSTPSEGVTIPSTYLRAQRWGGLPGAWRGKLPDHVHRLTVGVAGSVSGVVILCAASLHSAVRDVRKQLPHTG